MLTSLCVSLLLFAVLCHQCTCKKTLFTSGVFFSKNPKLTNSRFLPKQQLLGRLTKVRGGKDETSPSTSSKKSHVITIDTLADLQSLFQRHNLADATNPDSRIIVMDFTASWCGPCQQISPLLDEMSLSSEFKDKVLFVKIDVDTASEIAEAFQVNAMPTFFIWKNQRLQEKLQGANPAGLVNAIRKLL